MRIIFQKCLSVSLHLIKTNVRKVSKLATIQEHVTVRNQDTFTGRILLYLNADSENFPKSTQIKVPTKRHDTNNLSKLSTSAIIQFLNRCLATKAQNSDFPNLLAQIDREICSRSKKMRPEELFKLLGLYMEAIPNRITQTNFYKKSIKELFSLIQNLNGKNLVRFIFYVALQKKNNEAQQMLKYCFTFFTKEFVNNLTVEEICIICNSTFKTSTRIKSKLFLDRVKACIHENMFLLKDPALFVTLVKTLRHNKWQDDDLLETISCGVIFNKTYNCYSFAALCHIMALYADHYYYDERLLNIFLKQCLEQIEQSSYVTKDKYLLDQLRGKDLVQFLWVMSMFNEFNLLTVDPLEKVLIPKLMERIKGGEFDDNVDHLIDTSLYFWMLNYRPYDLLSHILRRGTLQKMKMKSKSPLRLNLLLHSIQVEDTEYFEALSIKLLDVPSNFAYQSKQQLQERPLLNRLLKALDAIKKDVNVERFEITQEIPYISFIGVTGYRGNVKAVVVEILDESNCIKNHQDSVPIGIMSLKIRLLECRAEGLLKVDEKEVEEMTENEFVEYLKDELMLIC